jgi:hypothetical protein
VSTWHYEQNNQPCGPVTAAALQELLRRRGASAPVLPPDTLVWKEGMADWAPANTIPEFSAVINAGPNTPPPLPHSLGIPPAGDSGAPPLNAPPKISSTIPAAANPTQADIEQNKVFAVLAYLGILFLVPLLAAPNSRYARYHTNQGIVLFISFLIGYFGSWVAAFLTFGLGFFLPVAVLVTGFIFAVLGIVNAASGVCKPLPLIGHFELMK